MVTEKRLIDANALKWKLGMLTLYVPWLRYGKTVISKILESYRRVVLEEIDNAPTVDAVEVVRCKDCKWYQIRKWDDGKPQFDCRKTHALLDVKPDDFCSYGERRSNGT